MNSHRQISGSGEDLVMNERDLNEKRFYTVEEQKNEWIKGAEEIDLEDPKNGSMVVYVPSSTCYTYVIPRFGNKKFDDFRVFVDKVGYCCYVRVGLKGLIGDILPKDHLLDAAREETKVFDWHRTFFWTIPEDSNVEDYGKFNSHKHCMVIIKRKGQEGRYGEAGELELDE